MCVCVCPLVLVCVTVPQIVLVFFLLPCSDKDQTDTDSSSDADTSSGSPSRVYERRSFSRSTQTCPSSCWDKGIDGISFEGGEEYRGRGVEIETPSLEATSPTCDVVCV